MLRTKALRELDSPVVLEAYGGTGQIWFRCYRSIKTGVVIERDPAKAEILARQRPTWSVYEAETVGALAAGLGAHLPVNFADFDPYGEPWPAIQAFFASERPFPPKMVVVVNDGMRRRIKLGTAWSTGTVREFAERHGNEWVYPHYLDVCKELMLRAVTPHGYRIVRWAGYYCGHLRQMTHYAAVLER